MKRFAMALMMITLAAPLWADYDKGSQSLSFGFGPGGFARDMEVNNGDNKLKDCGGWGSLQYLYFLKKGPTIAVGPEITWSELTEENNSSLLPGGKSKATSRSAYYQVVAKLSHPSGHWRPFVLGGLGAARSTLRGEVNTREGVTWGDTGTSESRSTYDSVKFAPLASWGAGLEWFPREHFFLGLEFRQTFLARSRHEPTAFGRSRDLGTVREPENMSGFGLRVGYKFGR